MTTNVSSWSHATCNEMLSKTFHTSQQPGGELVHRVSRLRTVWTWKMCVYVCVNFPLWKIKTLWSIWNWGDMKRYGNCIAFWLLSNSRTAHPDSQMGNLGGIQKPVISNAHDTHRAWETIQLPVEQVKWHVSPTIRDRVNSSSRSSSSSSRIVNSVFYWEKLPNRERSTVCSYGRWTGGQWNWWLRLSRACPGETTIIFRWNGKPKGILKLVEEKPNQFQARNKVLHCTV